MGTERVATDKQGNVRTERPDVPKSLRKVPNFGARAPTENLTVTVPGLSQPGVSLTGQAKIFTDYKPMEKDMQEPQRMDYETDPLVGVLETLAQSGVAVDASMADYAPDMNPNVPMEIY